MTTDPEFKRGWLKVPGVMWEDGNQVEQIKFKVDSHTRRLISRCNTMMEVWQVLDAEFAQEQEVINAVDDELQKLTSADCSTPQYIVELRNFLPVLEENLRSVKGVEHLCSPDRVHFLAGKFDERTMYDWEYFKSKTEGTTYERFFKFLEDRYEACRNTIARLKSASSSTTAMNKLHSVNFLAQGTNSEECRRCRSWVARDGIYTCPGCGRGTAVGEKLNHCLEHCGAYMKMNPNERSSCVESAKFCPIHLLGSHTMADCNMQNDPKFICGINGCQKHHHKSLHQSTTPFVASINATGLSIDNGEVLFGIQTIETTSGNANCLFDNCSTCCLITKNAAQRMNLIGEPYSFFIKTVTGYKEIKSHAYHLKLVDNEGNDHYIVVYEVEYISETIPEVSLDTVKDLFDQCTQGIWNLIDNRPAGEIDLLLGENVSGLHPTDWVVKGNLRIKSSIFGLGFVVTGSHPSIKSQGMKWNENVSYIRNHSVNKISIKPMQEYFAQDALGVAPPRRCGNCMNCEECGFRGQNISLEEQYEYRELESRVRLNPTTKCFEVSYAFTEDPEILQNNVQQVIKIAERLENRLIKTGLLDAFNREFMNMLKYPLVELSQEELAMWDGPKHYISLQHVVNESSPTTPLRIVGNSSLSDKRGISLNSICMKGPNTLSDQWEILSRWRSYETALCTDISKAYHSLHTGEIEKHVRRVVWRFGHKEAEWRTFAFQTVSFGDKPAATLLEIALKKNAEIHREMDPEASDRILRDRYVDDIASGGTPTQVARFVGQEGENFQCDGTLPAMLAKSSFNLKVIVTSGESNPEKLAKLGNKVLGVGYEATSDTISVDLSVYISIDGKKGDKVKLFRDSLLYTQIRNWLTKSNILGIINRIFDPQGLSTPITIKLRVEFRDLFKTDSILGWDDPIESSEIQDTWLTLIDMLVQAGKVTFPRATTPPNAVGKPQLICFFDGSDVAFAATIYIRWILADGAVKVILMSSKAHVTPLNRISTPRSELNGAVLASRLVLSSVKSLSKSDHLPERVWMIGGSECTLASLESVNSVFGEYFGNRIGEAVDCQLKIEQICPVGQSGEWYHTDSKNNAAD